jgi:hypothetical protein
MSKKPLILAIDDDEAEVRPRIPDSYELEVINPTEDDFSQRIIASVEKASLILLDQKFWEHEPPLSMTAPDGASFVSHLRSWSRLEGKKLAPIVLFTNLEDAFKNEIPSVGAALPIGGTFRGREHRLAPTLDVEWIQFKEEDCAKDRLLSLGDAYQAVHRVAGQDGASLKDIVELLDLPKNLIWSDRAEEELQNARPPISEGESGEAELARGASQVVRWLCHKALPYPGVFLPDLYAAWALGLSLDGFLELVKADPPASSWVKELHAARYKGPLFDFFGRRWWRAGIDQLVWQMEEQIGKCGSRKEALKILAPNVDVGQIQLPSSHVVVWDEDFELYDIVPVGDAIQLHPPGWPAEALEPWMLTDDVRGDSILRAMSDPADLKG